MTNNDDLALKLKAAAEKAPALNLDSAEIQRGNDGYHECPMCGGSGDVEAETDFCNIDKVALGVQFYGIGEHHGAAETYFRSANPANILSLLAERTADKADNASLRQRVAELERQLIAPLPIGELIQRLSDQTGEDWSEKYLEERTVSAKPAEEYPDDFDLQAAINMNDDYADYQTAQWLKELRRRRAAMQSEPVTAAIPVPATVNDVTNGKPLTITVPDTSSKAFWSGSGKSEVFHPETYKRWVKEAIERDCCIARIEVKVK